MSAVIAAARADFLERVRSFRFLAVLAVTVGLGMLMLPTADAGYDVLQVADARGVYNSAWVGLVFGVIGATVLPLFGFFVVKDALARDRSTRVGLMLAASPLSSGRYLGAKLLSNLGVFVTILAVSTVVALAMQVWRGEDRSVHLLDLALHLWAPALPVAVFTAGVALVFECVPGLRGAVGNVIFFFLWIGLLIPGLEGGRGPDGHERRVAVDFTGISAPLTDFDRHLVAIKPDRKAGITIGASIHDTPAVAVPWSGIAGDGSWLLERALWCLSCLPLLGFAWLFFDRFDPARARRAGGKQDPSTPAETTSIESRWHALTPLPPGSVGWRPLTFLAGELRLLLKRRPWWWYAGAGGFAIAGLVNAPANGLRWVVPLAWLWAITQYSELGARAEIHATRSLLWSAPAPLRRQLPLQWIAGVLAALLLASPVLLRLLIAGDGSGAAQMLVGAGFLSALALASGALSGGSRLFELGFLLFSYGLIENVPHSRYSGTPGLAFFASDAPGYLVATLVLVVAAAVLHGMTRRK